MARTVERQTYFFYLALPIPVSQQFKNFAPPEIYSIRPLPPTSFTTFLLFPQSTPITATIAFLLFLFQHHHYTTSVFPHHDHHHNCTTFHNHTFHHHHYHHQIFIVFALLPTHPFIRILFMTLRQRAKAPLALMYSCASL